MSDAGTETVPTSGTATDNGHDPGHHLVELELVEQTIVALATEQPDLSAERTFIRRQAVALIALAVGIAVASALAPVGTAITLLGLVNAFYVFTLVDRIVLVCRGLTGGAVIEIDDETARAIPDDDLPVYTVLLPAFNEPGIVDELIRGVLSLDYPPDKLDVLLLLEADDEPTVNAARGLQGVRVVLVPPAEPRTKPKACNVGLTMARGEYLTIYDAEDIPDPLQLRRVIVALRDADPALVCIQGMLGYFNERQNLLTGWFSVEYDQWFGVMLPALSRAKAPLPLGGTSNHIRTDVLREVGGWDPYNVTEDADLGIRLGRHGYRTAVLKSLTLEEANSDPVNWIRQRSRWYKGYLQTFLVHSRHPVSSARALGWGGYLRFCAFALGTPVSAVINMFMWGLTLLWFVGAPTQMRELFPAPLYFAALLSLVIGNGAVIYLGILTTCLNRKPQLLIASLLLPLYWVLMSLAAAKAFVQLLFQPSYWEKTVHGLHEAEEGHN